MYIRGMTGVITRTFRSGNSEAVRLPKEIAYGEGVELEAVRTGEVLVLRPKAKRRSPAETVALLRTLPRPTYIQEREPFDFPERG